MIHDAKLFADIICDYNEKEIKSGIGTLGERCLHAIIKKYYESDTSYHEIKVCGYVADICKDNSIIEIQTNNFSPLKRKLSKYLDEYKVKIVYPVSHVKNIIWIDPDTGETTNKRKSPKCGTGIELLYEASRIREYIGHPGLSIDILLIDMDEYKLLNGWSCNKKRGSSRCDRKPIILYDVITINSKHDYKKLIPAELFDIHFKYSDFQRATKLKGRVGRYSFNILKEAEVIEQVGKKGNAFIYRVVK